MTSERLMEEAEREGLIPEPSIIRQSGVHPRSFSSEVDSLRRSVAAAHLGGLSTPQRSPGFAGARSRSSSTISAGRLGDPARRVDAVAIAVQQQRRHHRRVKRELCGKVGDGVNQAADLISATASIPSLNFIPLTTFGNWF
jgi:hypothetical protein